MTAAEQDYFNHCKRIKDLHHQHFIRKHGQPPRAGHHIIPTCMGGAGDPDDWEDPNIVPVTPAENYEAHRLQALAWPNEPGVIKERILSMARGTLKTPEEFEKYVTAIYDRCHIYSTYVKDFKHIRLY